MCERKDGIPEIACMVPEQLESSDAHTSKQRDVGQIEHPTKRRRIFKALCDVSIDRWLTVLIGSGSLVVAILGLVNAHNTKNVTEAVRTLSALATQTKRQADAQNEQIKLLNDQVSEIRKQTEAISQQTKAIRASSAAAVQSASAQITAANAQKRMADVTSKAQMPDIDLSELSVSGLTSPIEKDGKVHINLFWRFRNTGGSSFTAKSVKCGLLAADKLPDVMPSPIIHVNGADFVISNSIISAFAPAEPIKLSIDPSARDRIIHKSDRLYFYAIFSFADQTGTPHQKCFGKEIIVDGDGGNHFVPAGGQAYRCQE